MNVDRYLARIQFEGDRHPSAETLTALQLAHLTHVPFENLSIHANEAIVLEPDALYDKIVRRRRGGFCYELNGLFAELLRALGFGVSRVAARVASAESGYSPPFDHMALLVSAEQSTYLVDVGFGDSFRLPLVVEPDRTQSQLGRAYKLVRDDDWLVLKGKQRDADWQPEYRFTQQAFELTDFVPRCHFHQTSAESHFRRGRVCTLATPDGRITLREHTLITSTLAGNRHERELADEAEVARVLAEQFGVVMA